MVQQKTGYPEEGEIVIATVTRIQYHSVFCTLDEYGKQGMIHISEIAPGRIRNIHEHVREGKTLVAKVLRIDKSKGHIDLSIRRVTEAQRRLKASKLKQEQIVEKVVEQLAHETKGGAEAIREALLKAFGDHERIFAAFQEVVEGTLDLSKAGLDKKLAEPLARLVAERISPRTVTIKGEFGLLSFAPDGVERVREAFKDLPENVEVRYAGGGRYATAITAKEYKQAEESLKRLNEQVRAAMGEDAQVVFERTDKR